MTDTAGVIGGLREVELALFGWLGRSAPSCSSPEEVVWASAASLRAAWRARELETLLPVSVGLVPDAAVSCLSSAATGSLTSLMSTVEERAGGSGGADESLPETAAALYEVLAGVYDFRLDRLSRAADGPLERVLCRVATDLQAEQAVVRRLRKQPGRGA
jgi:hypothetical protein